MEDLYEMMPPLVGEEEFKKVGVCREEINEKYNTTRLPNLDCNKAEAKYRSPFG